MTRYGDTVRYSILNYIQQLGITIKTKFNVNNVIGIKYVL